MTVRTIYATNVDPKDYATGPASWGVKPNASDCAVAIGNGSDGRFTIAVVSNRGNAYALVDRDELRLIGKAIMREIEE